VTSFMDCNATPYMDCNATTPIEPEVLAEVIRHLETEHGNAGSRTHEFGTRAKKAVALAREQVAAVVDARSEEVLFTSGATEANNLAILGLAAEGERSGRKHLVSTQIEHKSVLEPLEELKRRGFEVDLVPPNRDGWVEPETLLSAVRDDTLLISVMHVNNETGVVQPIEAIATGLEDHPAYFHVDAAQGYGKEFDQLRCKRLDLIAMSAHKIHGPKGVGALIARRRRFKRPPLQPLQFGGGQERGLRPGTQAVQLIVGLGVAAEIAIRDAKKRRTANEAFRRKALEAFAQFDPHFNGDPERMLSHVLNLSIPGLDSEAVMVALKGLAAISNGSACTSSDYSPSHVLEAMNLPPEVIQGALRISWCHLTESPDWKEIAHSIGKLL
jgi:cysteine desulfurase